MPEGRKSRGQGLIVVAISAVVAGVLLIAAGLLTMNSFECKPGQADSLSIDAGGKVKSNCSHVANSPALFVAGFALLFIALIAASWGFRARRPPPADPQPDELG